jgi:hypothetical protein
VSGLFVFVSDFAETALVPVDELSPWRVRNRTKGVTSNGIFSYSATAPTGLDLSIHSLSFHGSILMRPPRGNAAITLDAGFAADGCADGVAEVMVQFVRILSPKCLLIRLGIPFERLWNTASQFAFGTSSCGMGRAENRYRNGLAIQRAQRADRATRALSVAMPVFAYICR